MTTQTTPPLSQALRHWPVLVGVGTAVLMILDMATGLELAKVLAASAVVYLGAAAFGKPASTWPVFFLTFAVILAAELIDDDFEATWAVLGLGVLLGGYGLLRGYGPLRGTRPEPGGPRPGSGHGSLVVPRRLALPSLTGRDWRSTPPESARRA